MTPIEVFVLVLIAISILTKLALLIANYHFQRSGKETTQNSPNDGRNQ